MKTEKPTIALLMNSFWNAGSGGLSGGDQRLIQIFDRISKDFDILIITSQDGREIIKDRIKGAKYILSPAVANHGNLMVAYLIRTIWSLFILPGKKIDYLYGSSDFLPDVLPCYFNRLRHKSSKWIQCIFHYYPNWRFRPGNKVFNFIASLSQQSSFWFIKRKADSVVNINYQVKERLVSQGLPTEKIAVIPCGIDLPFFDGIKPSKEKFTGSFLARLNPSKGIFDLPKIWKIVVDKIPSAKLKIIGGGSDEMKKKLLDLATESGVKDNIELCGFLPNEKAFQIIADSNVFLFPSHEEGFGMAIAEAMACATPVVAWNLPVYGEVFPDVLITAEENDIEGFAQAVIKLLNDDKSAAELAVKSKKFVNIYGWDLIAKAEHDLIIKGA